MFFSFQVAYVTAPFPYVILVILLIRGLTLPGAWEGIYFYLYPDVNQLANLEVYCLLNFMYTILVKHASMPNLNKYH